MLARINRHPLRASVIKWLACLIGVLGTVEAGSLRLVHGQTTEAGGMNVSEAAESATTRTRNVLTEVPRVGFHPEMRKHAADLGPEDIIFPACMRAVTQYLGHPEYDYIHFVGVSGAMSFLSWREGWNHDSAGIFFMAPFEEHTRLFEDCFESTGYPKRQYVMLKGPDAAIDGYPQRAGDRPPSPNAGGSKARRCPCKRNGIGNRCCR